MYRNGTKGEYLTKREGRRQADCLDMAMSCVRLKARLNFHFHRLPAACVLRPTLQVAHVHAIILARAFPIRLEGRRRSNWR